MGLFSKKNRRIHFKAPRIYETTDDLVNPYRGWYQIHTFKLGGSVSLVDHEYTLNQSDTLAFVLIDISEYRDRDLDDIAFKELDDIFSFFKDYRLDMIVRVVYDTEGKCLEKEPATEDQIIAHLGQLVPIMKKFSSNVFVYQGLLIGNWGEMHSSKFLSPSRLRKLAEEFVDQVDFSYLAVRRPAYIRILFPEGEDIQQTKVGIFDDAILASSTHLGTFGEKPSHEVRREQSWLPEEEIEYVSSLCDRVPYGGEAIFSDEKDAINNIRFSLKAMSKYFGKLHLTYLNRIHDQAFISNLKSLVWDGKGIYKGMDGFQYMSRHLGYRFVLRDVDCNVLDTDKSILRWDITIENIGFARSFFENDCKMKAQDEFGNDTILDLSEWLDLQQVPSGTSHTFICMTPRVQGRIFLKFAKRDTNQALYFANKNQFSNGILSDIYIGTIKN